MTLILEAVEQEEAATEQEEAATEQEVKAEEVKTSYVGFKDDPNGY